MKLNLKQKYILYICVSMLVLVLFLAHSFVSVDKGVYSNYMQVESNSVKIYD